MIIACASLTISVRDVYKRQPLATRNPRPTICRYLASDNVGRANCTNSTSGQSNPSEKMSTFTNTCIGAAPSAARKQVAPSPSPARKQVSVRRSHPAQSGETFDGPPTLERSGSEHRVGRLHPLPFWKGRGLGSGLRTPSSQEGDVYKRQRLHDVKSTPVAK